MNPYKYSDEKINDVELMIAFPSIIIGIAILSLPRDVALATLYSDGWVSILLAGIFFTFIAIIAAKLAATFPNKSFYDYTAYLVTKPVAIGLVFINVVFGLFLSSYSASSISFISH